jgi:NADH-quinone oxidoreductase subunit J
MATEAIVFWAAGIFSVVGALMTITRKHPVASVMWLVLTFVGLAALFVGMEAYFVAVIQVLVYAGAIMVLFLFVVMLLDLKAETVESEAIFRIGGPVLKGVAVVSGVLLFIGLGMVVNASVVYGAAPEAIPGTAGESQVKRIAALLFSEYLLPFEITSALLLAAIVGAVVISRRGKAVES